MPSDNDPFPHLFSAPPRLMTPEEMRARGEPERQERNPFPSIREMVLEGFVAAERRKLRELEQQQELEHARKLAEITRQTGPVRQTNRSPLNFRSEQRRAVCGILYQSKDHLSDKDICLQLERDGVEPTGKLKGRNFVEAYDDLASRNLVERLFSAVRKAMRKAGIPVP